MKKQTRNLNELIMNYFKQALNMQNTDELINMVLDENLINKNKEYIKLSQKTAYNLYKALYDKVEIKNHIIVFGSIAESLMASKNHTYYNKGFMSLFHVAIVREPGCDSKKVKTVIKKSFKKLGIESLKNYKKMYND